MGEVSAEFRNIAAAEAAKVDAAAAAGSFQPTGSQSGLLYMCTLVDVSADVVTPTGKEPRGVVRLVWRIDDGPMGIGQLFAAAHFGNIPRSIGNVLGLSAAVAGDPTFVTATRWQDAPVILKQWERRLRVEVVAKTRGEYTDFSYGAILERKPPESA